MTSDINHPYINIVWGFMFDMVIVDVNLPSYDSFVCVFRPES